jgi:hypothetical protein
MKKIVRLTESQLITIIENVVKEQEIEVKYIQPFTI